MLFRFPALTNNKPTLQNPYPNTSYNLNGFSTVKEKLDFNLRAKIENKKYEAKGDCRRMNTSISNLYVDLPIFNNRYKYMQWHFFSKKYKIMSAEHGFIISTSYNIN